MMRFFALVFVTALLVAPEAPAASFASGPQRPQRLSVSPRVGGTNTTFRVPFTAHLASTGRSVLSGRQRVRYAVTAEQEAAKSVGGCADSYAGTVWVARADERVTAKLHPIGHTWCTGQFTGEITEVITPACGPIVADAREPAGACPEYIVAEDIGTFHFTVRR